MYIFEPLAQLAEHRTFNPGVPGSSPGRLTTIILEASVAQLVEQRTRNAQVSGPNPDAGSTSDHIKTSAKSAGVFFSVVLPILNHPLFLFSRPAIC